MAHPSAPLQGGLPAATSSGASPPHSLTPRELEVLTLIARGLDNAAIARRLSISRHTLHRHVSSIYAKLGGVSRTQAMLYAFRHNLANPADPAP